jgi:hypothetical protein
MKNQEIPNRDKWVEDDVGMSSGELQKIYSSIYKDFFNTHDIVLSGNGVLTWWVDISHGVSVLRIKQKLPLKTFCAANWNTSGKVWFHTILEFSRNQNTFKKNRFDSTFKSDINKISHFLEDFLRKHDIPEGIDIDFLTEAPQWHGFAFSSVISVLLTYLIHVIADKINHKISEEWWLIVDSVLFEELYLFSLELSNCISQGKSIGGGSNYAVMVPQTGLPIIYLSKKNNLDHANDTRKEKDVITWGLQAVDITLYKGMLLDFLGITDSSIRELPLDYGIIFTGLEYRFDEIESTREHQKNEEAWLYTFVRDIIAPLSMEKDDKNILLKLLSFDKNKAIYANIDETNLRILEWFDALLKDKNNSNSADIFIESIWQIGLSSFSYQKENRLFFALQHYFHRFQQFEDESIGIIPFNTGQLGGSFLFVMKKGKSRITMQKILSQLRDDGHNVSLDHASWRDGYPSEGIQLEQYISEKVYSSYTKAWEVLFVDSFGKSYSDDYETIIKDECDCLLLDTIWRRIYINGIKLTSKDIHSQNTTIDVLKILIENRGKEVSNSKLPISTYSQNKNEILTKIIIPLKKITQENFWKEISLSCSGWITEYFLKLEDDQSIKIGIIRTLQN